MKNWFLPSADSPAIQWLALAGILLLVSICLGGIIVWVKTARHGKLRRRHRKHRHHRHHANPTLAQTGGLPPRRDPNQPPPGP